MLFIAKNIEHKQKIETQFYEILSKYIYKYINHIFKKEYIDHKELRNMPYLYPDFQKKLLKISKWSNYTIDKEYYKFLKWCEKKYETDEHKLQEMLNEIIILTIQIMIHKPSLYVEKLIEHSFPDMKDFYYKCLKRLTRTFYENPKSTRSITLSELKDQIKTIVNIVLPINKIDTVLMLSEKESIKKNIIYDFEDKKSESKSTKSNSESNKSRKKSKSESDKEEQLYYISHDESNKENDQGTLQIQKLGFGGDTLPNIRDSKFHGNENANINKNISSVYSDAEFEKEIFIPKKKSYKYYNKSKVDEINEYFFNE